MSLVLPFIFAVSFALLGVWSAWQRRHAWGWWESPITLAGILVSVGVLALLPLIFWRGNGWWAWSYMLSYMTLTPGLGFFVIALKRRQQPGPLVEHWERRHVFMPSAIFAVAGWIFFYRSGAWHNPHQMIQDNNQQWANTEALMVWITVDTIGFYLFLRSAILLWNLKKDRLRGDARQVKVYLSSTISGMALCIIGALVATHHRQTALVLTVTVILLGMLFAPQVWMSGFSWQSKTRRMTQPVSHHPMCPGFLSSSPQPAHRCLCQHENIRQR